jgi:hypothetical protein
MVIDRWRTSNAAARLIQLVEDSFDLCRYYNILVESPKGVPLAQGNGQVPSTGDGRFRWMSIGGMSAELQVPIRPDQFIEQQDARMQKRAARRSLSRRQKVTK